MVAPVEGEEAGSETSKAKVLGLAALTTGVGCRRARQAKVDESERGLPLKLHGPEPADRSAVRRQDGDGGRIRGQAPGTRGPNIQIESLNEQLPRRRRPPKPSAMWTLESRRLTARGGRPARQLDVANVAKADLEEATGRHSSSTRRSTAQGRERQTTAGVGFVAGDLAAPQVNERGPAVEVESYRRRRRQEAPPTEGVEGEEVAPTEAVEAESRKRRPAWLGSVGRGLSRYGQPQQKPNG